MLSVIKSQLILEQRAQILAILDEGKSERSISKDLGTSKGTVGRVKREQETIGKLMDSAGIILTISRRERLCRSTTSLKP